MKVTSRIVVKQVKFRSRSNLEIIIFTSREDTRKTRKWSEMRRGVAEPKKKRQNRRAVKIRW